MAKTQFVLTEALSVATGVDLLKYGGVRKAGVLYLSKEESQRDILKRLRAIVLKHRAALGLTLDDVDHYDFDGNLTVLAGRNMPLNLGSEHRGEWTIAVSSISIRRARSLISRWCWRSKRRSGVAIWCGWGQSC